jgi:hypothetical protein
LGVGSLLMIVDGRDPTMVRVVIIVIFFLLCASACVSRVCGVRSVPHLVCLCLCYACGVCLIIVYRLFLGSQGEADRARLRAGEVVVATEPGTGTPHTHHRAP